MFNVLRNCPAALKNMSFDTDQWDPIIIHIALRKLDSESIRMFEDTLGNNKEMPSLQELYNFLLKRHEVLTSIKPQSRDQHVKKRAFTTMTKPTCTFCKEQHLIYRCEKFKNLSTDERFKFISSNQLCKNCLIHAKATKCKSTHRCFECNKPHHTLLHIPNLKTMTSNVATNESCQQPKRTDAKEASVNVLLPTALINVQSSTGQRIPLRALIDQGSQSSFITSKAAKRLGLKTQNILATISGIGDAEASTVRGKLNMIITPHFRSTFALPVEALIMPKLTTILPEDRVALPKSNNIPQLKLADPSFASPGRIDVILGAEIFEEIIEEGLRKQYPLLAQKTKLGWILSGKTISKTKKRAARMISCISMSEFHKTVEKFFEMDNDSGERELSIAEVRCEEHFQATHKRDNQGRYIVQLPFKEEKNVKPLGESRVKALVRYKQVEKRLDKDPGLRENYQNFLEEYVELGHMQKVAPYIGKPRNVFYLPHHPVLKEDSTTTKVRVVFDASAKTSEGPSLNDLLYTGAKLQQDLAQILLRWRRHRYVYTADIEKMFRQIVLAGQDRDFQRILWRDERTQTIDEYRLNTFTYGTACATFLAVRCLIQLAKDEGQIYPYASKVLQNDFYVDDMLSGADSKDEAIRLQKEVACLLKKGDFNLRKWSSNDAELLATIPENAREKGLLQITEDASLKTLGVHWNPGRDEFQFKIPSFENGQKLTKRRLLSNIATIYDPLQWLAPVTIRAKILMQDVWKTGVDWDEKPSPEITNRWNSFEADLEILEKIRIPRWIHYTPNAKLELHGFCDASEVAYAAVVYSRSINESGTIKTTLLCAKTKVTPLKSKISLPRLELNAAVLLSDLLHQTINSMNMPDTPIFAWSDSMITLGRLKREPSSLETYVANRVSKVQKLDVGKWQWNHVRSDENPADCASRGISPKELQDHVLWWNGPTWLLQKTNNEVPLKMVSMNSTKEEVSILERYSNLQKLIRITSLCLRFAHNCRSLRHEKKIGILQPDELKNAHLRIILLIQQQEYSQDIANLKADKETNTNIRPLDPFLDEFGIIRVGGRLRNASISRDAKFPILLPQRHHITHLIVREAHLKTNHGSLQLVRNYLRMRYWIVNDQKVIRYEIHRCITCCKFASRPNKQLMGNLPAVRITPSSAFTHCGVDYAGPFSTRMSKGRGSTILKGYIALFVCMVTKAVHLELVSDLSTEAFLAAFKRFISRRGLCQEIFSDNGTNFVGANNKMDRDVQEAIERSTSDLARITAKDGVSWKFIPVATPHFGGLWEAGVKSAKWHIKRVFDETKIVPTFEEFTTILCQIEACLNSRPITPLSSDPNDVEALTPGHLLIGRPLLALPEPDRSNKTLHERWQILTAMHQTFWNRWAAEYLHTLQRRTKWTKHEDNIKIGELVLLKERDIPPTKWPLARIHEVQPGSDGKVRTATVRYSGNKFKKVTIINICRLPVEVSEDNPSQQTQQSEKRQSQVTLRQDRLAKTPSKPIQADFRKRKYEGSEIIKTSRQSKRVRIAPCTWATKLLNIALLVFSLLTLGLANSANSSYDIIRPKGGFYVERLGNVHVLRGNLRLEVNLPIKTILQDEKNVISSLNDIKNMCQQTIDLSGITHCNTLMQHMETRQMEILGHIQEIKAIPISRQKRGLFDKLLTAVFGVNDEVYTDIDTLQKNQRDIFETVSHQGMLLSTRISQSNNATMCKLKSFGEKLNQVISSINEMKKWYAQIDHNRLSIQVISTYLTAMDYYDEIRLKYSKLTRALYGHESIINFVSLNTVNAMIQNTTQKIGSSFEVLRNPQKRITCERNAEGVAVYGYFTIIENIKYELIHVTAIPHKQQEQRYTMMVTGPPTIAVNFDRQVYFTLDQKQLEACKAEQELLICSPGATTNMITKANCILDEIYGRHNRTMCPTFNTISEHTLWKKLRMKNTWLFVADPPDPAHLICNGERQEIVLEDVGIIRIASNCIIETKEITLRSSLNEEVTVLGSYMKEISPEKFNTNTQQPASANSEPITKVSQQLFMNDFSSVQEPTTTFQTIKRHAVPAVSTISITLLLLLVGTLLKRRYQACVLRIKKNSVPADEHSSAAISLRDKFNKVITRARPTCSVPEQEEVPEC